MCVGLAGRVAVARSRAAAFAREQSRAITAFALLLIVALDSLDRAGGPTRSRRDAVASDGYARRSAPPKNRVPEYLARMLPAHREYRPPVRVEPVVACL